MTDNEKAAVFDLFGRCCTVSTREHTGKIGLGQKLNRIFYAAVRLELERIPQDTKRALVETRHNNRTMRMSLAMLELKPDETSFRTKKYYPKYIWHA
jgi:hypothetical protein